MGEKRNERRGKEKEKKEREKIQILGGEKNG